MFFCAASPRGLPGRTQAAETAEMHRGSKDSQRNNEILSIRYRADCRNRTERVKSWNVQAITRDDLSSRIKLVSEAKEVFNAIGIDGRLNFS